MCVEGGGDERDQPIGRVSRTRRRHALRGEGGEVRRERCARGDTEEARQVGLAGVGEATAGNGYRGRPGAERHLGGERRRGVDDGGAGDRRGRRLRERRVGEGAAFPGTGQDRRSVFIGAEIALDAPAQILDLRDHVVAAVVACAQAGEIDG